MEVGKSLRLTSAKGTREDVLARAQLCRDDVALSYRYIVLHMTQR
jgi:hypothetical protein